MTVTRDDLLRVIDENPADESSWLLYSDWLQQRGDPRGELIALDIALETEPEGERRDELTTARAALITNYGAQLLGDTFAKFMAAGYAAVTWRRGFITMFVYGGSMRLTHKRQVGWIVKLIAEHPEAFTFLHTFGMPNTDLEKLDLFTQFKHVSVLDLSHSNVVEIAPLLAMPALTRVNLVGCDVDEKAIKALKAARPNATILASEY